MAETDGIELEHHDEERHKVFVAPRSLNTSDAFNVLVRSTTHKVTDMLHAWARGEKKLAPDAETPVDAASGREKGGGQEEGGEEDKSRARVLWERLREDQHANVEHFLASSVRENVFFWNMPALGGMGEDHTEESPTDDDAPFSVHGDVRGVMESGGSVSESTMEKVCQLAEFCCNEESVAGAVEYVLGHELFHRTQCFRTDALEVAQEQFRELKSSMEAEGSNVRLTKAHRNVALGLGAETLLEDYKATVERLKDFVTWNNPAFDGYTALHISAVNGSHDTMRVLLNYAKDAFVENDFGETPLHLAAMTKEDGNTGVIQLLLDFAEAAEDGEGKKLFHGLIKRRTLPRLDDSLQEKDNGDGRLIKDSKGETKPFGMQFLHQNINGGKTANGIAKEVGNFNVVALLNQYRLKDPGIDEDDIDKIVTRHWCCSNKNFERVKRAACDF